MKQGAEVLARVQDHDVEYMGVFHRMEDSDSLIGDGSVHCLDYSPPRREITRKQKTKTKIG